jgi:SNF family Na+-dependent transporter
MIFAIDFDSKLSALKRKLNFHKFLVSGAFLIPFMIMLVLEGIPLFLIELGMGQRIRLGALGVWNTIHPWLGGIGISSCVVTLFVAIYYNVIITWCIFYFVKSFRVSKMLMDKNDFKSCHEIFEIDSSVVDKLAKAR